MSVCIPRSCLMFEGCYMLLAINTSHLVSIKESYCRLVIQSLHVLCYLCVSHVVFPASHLRYLPALFPLHKPSPFLFFNLSLSTVTHCPASCSPLITPAHANPPSATLHTPTTKSIPPLNTPYPSPHLRPSTPPL